jgi:gliding motility-associated lipoprotein GldD
VLKKPALFFISSLLLFSLFYACKGDYTPKPRGHFRIDLPEKVYVEFDSSCPFTFQFPSYAIVVPDNSPGAEPCWLNVRYLPFNATLHLSYKDLKRENLDKLLEDSRSLAFKHTVKAEEILEGVIRTENNVNGMRYEMTGNTATAMQFYLTDSTKNYLRGALYFNVKTEPDSIGPVVEFLSKDISRMINTLKWK